MISSNLKAAMVAVALCVLAGAAGAQGRESPPELQVAQIPFWVRPYLKEYRKQPHFRAMACARTGRGQGDYCFGYYPAPTARAAADGAMEMCGTGAQRLGIFAPCRLIFIGDTVVSGMRRAELDRAIEEYQAAAGPPGLWPGFRPGPVKGVAGVSFQKFTVTSGVIGGRPKDNRQAVSILDQGFYIHVQWVLDLAVVKRLIVRYELFDAAGRLVAERSDTRTPTQKHTNTWYRADISELHKPGKWKVSVYVSTGPGETKVGETYLDVKPD